MSMDARWKYLLTLAPLAVVLDQASKWIVNETIPLNSGIVVIDGFFNLVNIRNRGAAFGMLNRSDIDWQVWLFLASTIVATAVIITLMRKSGQAPLLWSGLSLILGGAFGNLIDRLKERAVTDFLDVYYGAWHWPAFNVADIAICVGAGLTVLAMLLGHDRRGLAKD